MSKAYLEDSRLDIILLSFYIFKREYYIIKKSLTKKNPIQIKNNYAQYLMIPSQFFSLSERGAAGFTRALLRVVLTPKG